ncbi:hypothetical protein [Streptomyces melanogenes]|uniref:Secreted protein n=1 Tax=Streptomyces melanogenes TaxID=67326 RepID=A0ABZ1XEF8_9ACTN|nr:hypothetical protein [Streptomyces melanogenes]
MLRFKNITLAAAGLGLAAAGLLAGAGTATAGGNGQQVTVSTRWSDQIRICGRNQADEQSCTGWIASPNPWTPLPGWWWKGELVIQGYQQDTGEYRLGYCDVPTSQSDNWTKCNLYGTL